MSFAEITLSSRLTFFTKIVFPTMWIGGFGAGTIVMWIGKVPSEVKWSFLAIFAVGSLFILFYCARLKRVRVDGKMLYVSNYLKEIAVPLSVITHISENWLHNFHPVTLSFGRTTEFGNKIAFMPKIRMMPLWRSHPVVDEIKRMVERATLAGEA